MTSFDPTRPTVELLDAVVAIARSAGRAIMQVYASDFSVEHKQDDSPLTLADREAHRIISAGLQQLTPDIPVLSEESSPAQHAYSTRRQWHTLWLVDPLDGTREFVKRNGEFTVNIALIHAHRPVLGVIAIPAQNAVYYGTHSHGAHCALGSQPGKPIHTRTAAMPPVIAGSRSHRGESLSLFLQRLGAYELCAAGSALKFCRLAEGLVDCYPRLSPTSEWDSAAGQALVEAAGGQVLELNGEPLSYNRRDTLLNPHFIAIGDARFAWQPLLG